MVRTRTRRPDGRPRRRRDSSALIRRRLRLARSVGDARAPFGADAAGRTRSHRRALRASRVGAWDDDARGIDRARRLLRSPGAFAPGVAHAAAARRDAALYSFIEVKRGFM